MMNYVLKERIKGLNNAYIEMKLLAKEFFAQRKNTDLSKQRYLELQMLLGAHLLEKGMSLRQTKKGYGKEKARKVLAHMQHWKDCGYALDNFAFLETAAVIEAYI